MKPTKPPISPMIKWVVIGFLGTIAMLLIFAGIVVTRLSPLLHVDDLKDFREGASRFEPPSFGTC